MKQDLLKYNFELDMKGDNSNSLILRKISPNSEVLEFGPAHGRMTKYLRESLNCNVTIIEKNDTAGQFAKTFATQVFLGKYMGDIEELYWYYKLLESGQRFDYIIFADVLEHLYDPWKILSYAVNFLNENGRILISVPNVGHNSVIIDLLNGKFDYRELGLLDNTHLRFFTRKSLEEMVHGAGLEIEECFDPRNAVENTEFGNSLNDVPENIAKYLKKRKDADVYQFVWSLKKGNT